jgi:hypothetical protein
MNKEYIRNRIKEIGVIPAIRLSSTHDALFAAEAVLTCPPKTLPFITEKLRKTDEGKGALR